MQASGQKLSDRGKAAAGIQRSDASSRGNAPDQGRGENAEALGLQEVIDVAITPCYGEM